MPEYAFEREHDRGLLTSRDFQRIGWGGHDASNFDQNGDVLPPDDVVVGGAVSMCVACRLVPLEHRCATCPRARPRHTYSIAESFEQRPRHRWWHPRRKANPKCPA